MATLGCIPGSSSTTLTISPAHFFHSASFCQISSNWHIHFQIILKTNNSTVYPIYVICKTFANQHLDRYGYIDVQRFAIFTPF